MTPRFDLLSLPGQPSTYSVTLNLGEEPTDEQMTEAFRSVRDRMAEELEARGDAPSKGPHMFAWCLNKTWRIHLLAVGQPPAKEKQ